MAHNRRALLLALLAAPVALRAGLLSAAAQTGSDLPPRAPRVSDLPNPTSFQSGDFVWPKKKGAFVPRYSVEQTPSAEQQAWHEARERLLREDLSKSGISPEVAETLRKMTYEEFEILYFAGPAESAAEGPNTRSVNIGGQTIFVGHVGIVEIDAQGASHVVEAAAVAGLKGTVVRSSYVDWLKKYSGMQVWHGRVPNLTSEVRTGIA